MKITSSCDVVAKPILLVWQKKFFLAETARFDTKFDFSLLYYTFAISVS